MEFSILKVTQQKGILVSSCLIFFYFLFLLNILDLHVLSACSQSCSLAAFWEIKRHLCRHGTAVSSAAISSPLLPQSNGFRITSDGQPKHQPKHARWNWERGQHSCPSFSAENKRVWWWDDAISSPVGFPCPDSPRHIGASQFTDKSSTLH